MLIFKGISWDWVWELAKLICTRCSNKRLYGRYIELVHKAYEATKQIHGGLCSCTSMKHCIFQMTDMPVAPNLFEADHFQVLQMPSALKSTLTIKSSTSRILTGKEDVRVTDISVIRSVLGICKQVVTCGGFLRPLGEESKVQSKIEYSRSHHDLPH